MVASDSWFLAFFFLVDVSLWSLVPSLHGLSVRVLQRNGADYAVIPLGRQASPKICRVSQVETQESQWWSPSPSENLRTSRANRVGLVWRLGVFRPRRAQVSVWVQRQGKGWCPRSREKIIFPYCMKGQLFCPIQAFSWLGEAHPHQEGQSAFPSLLIQMLIST